MKASPALLLRLPLLFALAAGAAQAGVLDGIKDRLRQLWEEKHPYPVVKSGYWTTEHGRLAWVDAQRLIFTGGRLGKDEWRDTQRAIHIWDLSRGKIEKHADAPGFCFHKGILSYRVSMDDREYVWKEGPVGEEVVKRKPAEEIINGDRLLLARGEWRHPLTCGLYKPKELRTSDDHLPFPLLEGHGYLDLTGGALHPEMRELEKRDPVEFHRRVNTAPVRYFSEGSRNPIVLPFDVRGAQAPNSIQYIEWADRYVIFGEPMWRWRSHKAEPLRQSEPYPVYLLRPADGYVEVIQAPPHANWPSGSGYVLTRKGLVMWHHEIKGGGIGDAGLYRVLQDGYQKLLAGSANSVAVSPDGCRLAVALKYWQPGKPQGPSKLKIIELCKGGEPK